MTSSDRNGGPKLQSASSILIGLLTLAAVFAGIAPEPSANFDPEGVMLPRRRLWLGPDGKPLPFQSDAAIAEFLETAAVVSRERIGEGINRTEKVLLEKDGVRMHAAFRTIHGTKYIPEAGGDGYVPVRDDHAFEVAAYRICRMLGLAMVPPTVPREIDGVRGSLQAWVESAMMEKDRRKKKIQPPDEWYWMSQMLTMRLVDNLVANTDRHQGNLLVDPDWEVWLIDHTQAFRPIAKLFSGDKVLYCDRQVWWRLKHLDPVAVRSGLAGLLGEAEIQKLFERRDLLVRQIQGLIDANGAQNVLFSWEGEAPCQDQVQAATTGTGGP